MAGRAEPPIFVAGLQRSGTTLLQGLLGSHPRIAAPPEIYYIARVVDQRTRLGDPADDEALRRIVHETLNPPYPLLEGCGFDEDALYRRLLAGRRTYAAVLDAVLSDFAARQGKPRWCEKSPGQPADRIWQLFPDAQVVHIVRDPREAIASQLALSGEIASHLGLAGPHAIQPPYPENATTLGIIWRDHTQTTMALGAERGPDQYFRVRLEDLTRAPRTILREVLAFLGEDSRDVALDDPAGRRRSLVVDAPWQRRVLDPIEPTDAAVGSRLTRADRLRVAAVTGRLLPGLGYVSARRRARVLGSALAVVPRLALRRALRRLHALSDAEQAEVMDEHYRRATAAASTAGGPA